MRDEAPPHWQFDLHVGRGADGGTAILSRHVAWPWSLPRGFRLAGRCGPLTVLPQAAGAALLPGDVWRHRVRLDSGRMHLVSAGAALAHGGAARVDWDLSVQGGVLALMPDPWVLSPGARVVQRIEATLAPGTGLVLMDGFCLRDNAATDGTGWDSETIIRGGGGVLLCDRQIADAAQMNRLACLPGRMRAFGQVLIVMPSPPELPHGPWDQDGVWGATAPLRDGAGLMIRLAAVDGGRLSAAMDRLRNWLRSRV